MSTTTSTATEAESKLRSVVLAVNILYALSFVLGVTSIVGVVMAHIKRGEAAGTPWESHLTYAIRTFWLGLLMALVGLVLSFIGIGLLILLFVAVWYIIRVVRGFLAWNDGVAIANPRRFF